MRGLAGKNVIVTGAASGIGRACAARLLEEGASVMGADLARGGGRPRTTSADGSWAFTTVDVTDEASVVHLVDEAARPSGASTASSTRRGWPEAAPSTWSTARNGTASWA